jgi:prepilin-type processing-associated H-X9-DG protein
MAMARSITSTGSIEAARSALNCRSLHPGTTNLVFVDAHGLVIANVRISVCASGPNACDAAAGRA